MKKMSSFALAPKCASNGSLIALSQHLPSFFSYLHQCEAMHVFTVKVHKTRKLTLEIAPTTSTKNSTNNRKYTWHHSAFP